VYLGRTTSSQPTDILAISALCPS
jgi:hypothetical protein